MDHHAMECWKNHCSFYFRQDLSDCRVLLSQNPQNPHVDMLLFPPGAAYPFYKLCTMGASDYRLPFSRPHEFIMFLAREEDLSCDQTLMWYRDVLLTVALYPARNHFAVGFGHSIVWGAQPGTDMCSAYLDLPYPIEGPGFFNCRLGPLRKTACLQVTLLTDSETQELIRQGPGKFCDFLYPPEGKPHFLCQRYRSPLF